MQRSLQDEKNHLRAIAKERRSGLVDDSISCRIRENIEQWPVFQQAQTVLTFAALPGEVDLLPLMAQYPQKQWYLPRVITEEQITFYRVLNAAALLPGQFGILEPEVNPEMELQVKNPDLVFVPALLIDVQGVRLGFGRGYYDRFLATLDAGVKMATPIPEVSVFPSVPQEPWDVSMHWGITELGIRSFT